MRRSLSRFDTEAEDEVEGQERRSGPRNPLIFRENLIKNKRSTDREKDKLNVDGLVKSQKTPLLSF